MNVREKYFAPAPLRISMDHFAVGEAYFTGLNKSLRNAFRAVGSILT